MKYLELRKETLRTLKSGELDSVRGGTVTWPFFEVPPENTSTPIGTGVDSVDHPCDTLTVSTSG